MKLLEIKVTYTLAFSTNSAHILYLLLIFKTHY
jgi:hypothetical protein